MSTMSATGTKLTHFIQFRDYLLIYLDRVDIFTQLYHLLSQIVEKVKSWRHNYIMYENWTISAVMNHHEKQNKQKERKTCRSGVLRRRHCASLLTMVRRRRNTL